jgi:soluble lytic murein transglycosylase-like protein
MPTIELTINGKPQRVEVGENATPADIDEIATHLSAGEGAPATQETPTSTDAQNAPTVWGRIQQQAAHLGRGYLEAGQRIGSEMFPELISAPPGTPDPKERTILSRLGDLALVTSPVVAPELMLAGTGASIAARAAGAPEPLADVAGAVTELGVGGVQTVSAVKEAIQTPAKAAEAAKAARTAQAVENVAAGTAEAGEAAQTTRGAAAAGGAAGISDAAATKQAAEDIERLQTATPAKAGEALRETYPSAEAGRRSAFQEGTYNKIAQYADKNGLTATTDNTVGQKLATDLRAAEDEWGELARGAEHKQVNKIMDKLNPAREPTGVIDPATGQVITRPAAGGVVTWQELDDAEKALQRVSGPSSVRKAIADAKKGLLEGTPAAKALDSANQQWRLTIRPAKILAAKITKAESPVDAFRQVVGTGTNPQRLDYARKVLVTGGHPEQWSKVVGGFFTDLAQRAKGDPLKMAKLWEGVRPGVRAVIDPDGVAAEAFTNLTKAGTREVPPPVSLAEPVSRGLPELPATSGASKLTQYGPLSVGGTYAAVTAIPKFYNGDWWGGLKDLGIGAALANPRIAASMVRPLARTGAAVVGSPAGQGAVRSYEKFLTAPSELEQTTPEAEPAPAPQDLSAAEPKMKGAMLAASPAAKETASYQASPGFHNEIQAVANVVGVPANLVRSVIKNESGGDPSILSREAVGGVHAHGLMQIMPTTFEAYRKRIEAITGRDANIDDPLDNLVAGALHLRDDLAASGGDIASTARRYTGGPDPRRWGMKTHSYGNKVARDYAMMERG